MTWLANHNYKRGLFEFKPPVGNLIGNVEAKQPGLIAGVEGPGFDDTNMKTAHTFSLKYFECKVLIKFGDRIATVNYKERSKPTFPR